MLKITYTNGDVQNIKVAGDFFTLTLVTKEGIYGDAYKVKLSPIEKAEELAFDCASKHNLLRQDIRVSSIELTYPNQQKPKLKVFRPVDIEEVEEPATPTPSYIKALKEMKKEWKNKKPEQRWVWTF